MKWKTTIILLTLVIGIGAYVSLYELRQPTPEQREARSKRILQLDEQAIASLAVEVPHAKVSLAKADGVWRLTSPLTARAERSLTEQIISQLQWLEAERVLAGTTEQPLDRAHYGLAPPLGNVTIVTAEGTTVLLFGEATAVGGNRYVARSEGAEVFVVGSYLFDTLNQPVESYRSHELVGVELGAVTGLTVSSPSVSYELKKVEGMWKLAPEEAADLNEVNLLLSELNTLRIQRFLEEQAEISAHPEWGFQTPTAKISVTMPADEPPLEITLGAGTNDNAQQRYATRSDEPTLYAVNGADVDALLKDPATLIRAEQSAGGPDTSAATPSGESIPPTPPASTTTDHAPAASR